MASPHQAKFSRRRPIKLQWSYWARATTKSAGNNKDCFSPQSAKSSRDSATLNSDQSNAETRNESSRLELSRKALSFKTNDPVRSVCHANLLGR